MNKLSGVITLLISIVLFWFNIDIITELIDGRPLIEVKITDLILPVILLIVALFLLFKKAKDEKK